MRLIRCLAPLALGLMIFAAAAPARAIDAVSVRSDAPAIDLTAVLDHQRSESDRIQVSTAPGTDGIVRRIEVRAREGGQFWVVFALANNTDDQLDRLIVAPHYRIVSSGLLWPDLGLSRLATITPSVGDRPERQENPTADVFRITLDPGAVVTYVAELRTDKLPQLYLWEPDAYKDKVNSFTLYQGIVIGISGLLALVLTILFVVKGSIMFPAAAALAWADIDLVEVLDRAGLVVEPAEEQRYVGQVEQRLRAHLLGAFVRLVGEAFVVVLAADQRDVTGLHLLVHATQRGAGSGEEGAFGLEFCFDHRGEPRILGASDGGDQQGPAPEHTHPVRFDPERQVEEITTRPGGPPPN